MSEFSDMIREGLAEVEAYVNGEDTGAVEHVVNVPVPDVKALRKSLGLSQAKFAAAFEIPLGTVQCWEQGRRVPRGTARILLQIIEREPEAVRRVLALESG